MNVKNTTGIISFGLILLCGAFLLSGCTKDSSNSNSSADSSMSTDTQATDVAPGQPYLKMTLTDYPSTIADSCQDVSFTIQAKNIGDTALSYSDFADKYSLTIYTDDALSSFDNEYPAGEIDSTSSLDDYGLITLDEVLTDFGTIEPGETTTLVFNSMSFVIYDQNEYFWNNPFTSVANGTGDFYFIFEELPEEGKLFAKEISRSDSVSITTSVWAGENEYTACDYEVITDESIDFYN